MEDVAVAGYDFVEDGLYEPRPLCGGSDLFAADGDFAADRAAAKTIAVPGLSLNL